MRIDTLADGCLNITSGLVGSAACGAGGSNSKWATTTSTYISTNGATRVAIGSTTPFATFAINPVAGEAPNQFVVGSSTRTAFIIDNAGNAGIGTSTPEDLLNIHASIDTSKGITIKNANSGTLAGSTILDR